MSISAAVRQKLSPAALRDPGIGPAPREDRQRSGSAARFPVRNLIRSLLEGEHEQALDLSVRVLYETRSRTSVFADLLQPAQLEISNLWYAGRVTRSDEVRVAEAVAEIVTALPSTPVPRKVPEGSRCVLAVPRGDPHDLGLRMLTLALQDHGWTTELLGPTRHLCEVAEVVVGRRPSFFGLSAGVLPPGIELQSAIRMLREARIPVLVGGAAFNRRPDLWRGLGAAGPGPDLRVGVVLAEKIGCRRLS